MNFTVINIGAQNQVIYRRHIGNNTIYHTASYSENFRITCWEDIIGGTTGDDIAAI